MLDLNSALSVDYTLPVQLINSDTDTDGATGVSLADNHSAIITFVTGVLTDGDYLPVVLESVDGGSTWTAVAAADLHGALEIWDADTDDDAIQTVGYKGSAGMINVRITSTNNAGSGATLGAFVTLGDEKQAGGSSIVA